MKKIVIIFSLPWMLIVSCKKDKADPPSIVMKFSSEALAYVQLPLNKYFIYKDSASGTFDSVVVKESSLQTIFVPKYDCPRDSWCISTPAYNYQTFTLKLVSITTSTQKNWYFESAFHDVIGGFYQPRATDTMYVSLNGTFWYPFYLNNTPGSLVQVNLFPSIIIEGKTYTDVLQCVSSNTDNTSLPNYTKTNYYWAKGIGIIKREIRTATTVKTELLVRHG